MSKELFKKTPLALCVAAIPGMALAGPQGGDVVAGSASISSPSAQGTVINQASSKAIINWQSFSIGGNEYVQFNQPDASSISLNRVVGADPSAILGNLSATGQVFLVNPNGIFFGANATLDVGGLVASTLDIKDDDFLSGNYFFTEPNPNAVGASVVNEGVIQARDNGYVVLASDRVENHGTIKARYGRVALLANGGMTLDIEGDGLVSFSVNAKTVAELAGVENTGDIMADGGRVVLYGNVTDNLVATAVNNTGLIQANGTAERNGEIFLTGNGGDVINSGILDASAILDSSGNGGRVIVYSDEDVDLTPTSVIDAQGDGTGSGGFVRVIADGTLNVRQGHNINAASGSAADLAGGFVEVSGHTQLNFSNDGVNVGRGGSILIDPANVCVTSGSGCATMGFTSVSRSFVENNLFFGNSVIVAATSQIELDTNINAPSFSSAGPGNLTLGIGTVAMASSSSGSAGFSGPVATPPILTPLNGGSIDLKGNDITIAGDVNIVAQGGVVQKVNNIVSTSGDIAITANAINAFLDSGGLASLLISNIGGTGSININGNINAVGPAASVLLRAGNSLNVNGNVNVAASSLNATGQFFGNNVSVNNVSVSAPGSALIDFDGFGSTLNVAANGNVIANGAASTIFFSSSDGGPIVNAGGPGLYSADQIIFAQSANNVGIRTNASLVSFFGSASSIKVDNRAFTGNAIVNLDNSGSSFNTGLFDVVFGGNGAIVGDVLNAGAIAVFAPGNLTANAGFDVGPGTTPVQGDPVVADFVAANALMDGNGTASPNASFISGGTLNLNVGSLSQSNRYLFLAADVLNLSGTSSAQNLLAQLIPFTIDRNISLDGSIPGSTLTTNYTDADHLSRFSGTTVVIGGGGHQGSITIGANGAFDIGSKNLLLGSIGDVTGIENVTGTGLIAVIASTVFPTVLLSEVSSGSATDSGTTEDDPAADEETTEEEALIEIVDEGTSSSLNLTCS